MEFWDILESIFHWVVVIPVTILGYLIFFALIILILVGCVFNLFFKENPEKIVNLQIKKLQKVTGMSLPPYTLTAHEKMKDYLPGTIHIKFNEFLNEELLEELNKHIKNGDALRLCAGRTAWSDQMLVEVVDTTFNSEAQQVEYHLGKVVQVDVKSTLGN